MRSVGGTPQKFSMCLCSDKRSIWAIDGRQHEALWRLFPTFFSVLVQYLTFLTVAKQMHVVVLLGTVFP